MSGDRDDYNVSQLQLLGTRTSIAAEETAAVLRCRTILTAVARAFKLCIASDIGGICDMQARDLHWSLATPTFAGNLCPSRWAARRWRWLWACWSTGGARCSTSGRAACCSRRSCGQPPTQSHRYGVAEVLGGYHAALLYQMGMWLASLQGRHVHCATQQRFARMNSPDVQDLLDDVSSVGNTLGAPLAAIGGTTKVLARKVKLPVTPSLSSASFGCCRACTSGACKARAAAGSALRLNCFQ